MDTSNTTATQMDRPADTTVTPSAQDNIKKPGDAIDAKKAEHEASEAKRKAEWDANQAKKKAGEEKTIADLQEMTDEEIIASSVERTGGDLEKMTRRSMKICVTEHIQALCKDDVDFARNTMHPRKSMINCFKYIYEKANEYVKQEMEMNGEKSSGMYMEDVPDDLCYGWAEDYFNDPNARVDMDKDDKFVPKPYYGGSSSTKPKKKEAPKAKEPDPAKLEQVGFNFEE